MLNKIEFIGVIGVIGSGKTHFIQSLKKELHYLSEGQEDIIIDVNFADPLRKMLQSIIPFSDNEYRQWKEDTTIINGGIVPNRSLLTSLGKAGRDIDKDIWINLTLSDVKNRLYLAHKSETTYNVRVCFGDIRYLNELKAIFNFGETFGKDCSIYFTNYKSQFYEIKDTESEKFAQSFLNVERPILSNITEEVHERIERMVE